MIGILGVRSNGGKVDGGICGVGRSKVNWMVEGVWSHDFDTCRIMEVEWKRIVWEYDKACGGKWT